MATSHAQEPASVEPTTVEKLRGLPWSIASNAANTVFVQYTFFGSIFVLFLSALGLSKSQMGFLLSLLPFFGLIALFVAPWVARFGYKRTYLTFFGIRALIAAGLLATPLVLNRYGAEAALVYVAATTALFSGLRAIGVTASFPWAQEYVPNSVRGKYTAMNNIFTTAVGFLAVTAGGMVLARTTGLTGYMVLIAIGVIFGWISVGLAFLIPGGAPMAVGKGKEAPGRDLRTAAQDRDFVRYLVAVGLITLVTVPLGSFLPLFMREEVGLNESQVVLLQTGTLVGSLLSSYGWGWAADRYGSIPVTLYGLSLRALLPLFWMWMPRESPLSLWIALAIAFLQGVADMGWGIGSGRMLYVNIVPPAKRTDYMALYYAWIGIVGGISQLSGGALLDLTQGLSGEWWVFRLDPYLPLFLASLVVPFVAFTLLRQVHEDRAVSMGQFAGIFLRGNPFLAMSSMIRYHLARDEHSAVLMTERLGQAKSPLTVEELLEALEDPRFNVRFEAIISIARMPPDPRLRQALVSILEGSELALTVVAAWALGRMGDEQAIEPLRRALDSSYRSVRAHSARALGALRDREITPVLLARLQEETDKGLQMAYASALGNIHAAEATPQLLALLAQTENPGARLELALSLARIVGEEHHFIHLLRQMRADPGTALSQALAAWRRRLDKRRNKGEVERLALACEETLARGDLDGGSRLLVQVLRCLPPPAGASTGIISPVKTMDTEAAAALILAECARRLEESGAAQIEYVLLALHTLQGMRH
ncbi:MAG TPA: MFS transporter [Caldilineaceae bacterium]|nr:MFS transporter [Caldilineaceae bacterium]